MPAYPRFAAMLWIGSVLAVPARASILTVSFGGTFTSSTASCSPYSHASDNCAVTAIATPFSGSFSYSTTTPGTFTGGTLTSDALGPITGRTTLTETNGASSYEQLSGGTVTFGNVLGSLFGDNLATLALTWPVSAGATLDAPLPPFSAATGSSMSFISDVSPGGTGPSLSGVISTFVTTDASAVPEAATWASMLVGAAATGGALRRRRTRLRAAYA